MTTDYVNDIAATGPEPKAKIHTNAVYLSICIPAYKNTSHLARLLDSVTQQSFRDFEVVITDDSPDDSVEQLVLTYKNSLPIHYSRNKQQLGTPENWNESIRHASGKWIKMMHNDDWFAHPDALDRFVQATREYPDCPFFFAAFQNVEEDTGKTEIVKCSFLDRWFLGLSTLHLFKRVYVGNPSCTLIRRDVDEWYDKRFRFVVDFEFYIRCFKKGKRYKYLSPVLLNIGFHAGQVTRYTFLVPSVQLPENLLLINLMGVRILRNPFVFDYYWRLFRNMSIRDIEQVREHWEGEIPTVIAGMIRLQSRIPARLLRSGLLSKATMSLRYCRFMLTGN